MPKRHFYPDSDLSRRGWNGGYDPDKKMREKAGRFKEEAEHNERMERVNLIRALDPSYDEVDLSIPSLEELDGMIEVLQGERDFNRYMTGFPEPAIVPALRSTVRDKK